MAVLNQTVAVVDKSGKVVSTSKHLFGVFKEAKTAYRERKAEIQADKQLRIAEKEALKALESYTIDDSRSVASSRRSKSSARHRSHPRGSHAEYRDGQPFYQLDSQSGHSRHRTSRAPEQEIVRRHTSHDVAYQNPTARPATSRSMSAPHVDMDLAYGEYHAPTLAEKQVQVQTKQQAPEQELDGLVTKVTGLLEEADCAQHTVTATIAHLQKNPDAMAAVALTLAEISNVVAKLAPAALATLKASAPTIFALLASPQFLIAAGVGIGVTVVMFGGYKIIKHIQQTSNVPENQPTAQPMGQPRGEEEMEEMMELASDCSGVESWRRGVADVEAESWGTSVDGEFITRRAANMSGILVNDRVDNLRSSKSVRSSKTRDRDRDDVSRASTRSSRSSRSSKTSRSERTEKTSKTSKSSKHSSDKDKKKKEKKKEKEKEKKPSPLRMMFRN